VASKLDQSVEFFNFRFEFGHVLGHRQAFDDIILEFPAFGFGQVIEVIRQFAIFLLELAELLEVFEPFAAAFQRRANSGQAGCEAALKHGERQADIAILGGFGSLEIVLHVFGNGVVQLEFFGGELGAASSPACVTLMVSSNSSGLSSFVQRRLVSVPTAWTSIRLPRALAVKTLTVSVQCGPSRIAPSSSCRKTSSRLIASPQAAEVFLRDSTRQGGRSCLRIEAHRLVVLRVVFRVGLDPRLRGKVTEDFFGELAILGTVEDDAPTDNISPVSIIVYVPIGRSTAKSN
jgi:hypothetical protein